MEQRSSATNRACLDMFNVRTSCHQAGRRLGRRHLRKLFKAVGRGCLQGTSSVEEKVKRLSTVASVAAVRRLLV